MDKYVIKIYSEQSVFNGRNVLPLFPLEATDKELKEMKEYVDSISRYIMQFYPEGSKIYMQFRLVENSETAVGGTCPVKKESNKHNILKFLKNTLNL